MIKKRTPGYLIRMNAVHLGNNYLWISFESYILPVELMYYKNSSLFLGIIAFFGTLIGILTALFIGNISDRFGMLWGKRSPYIMIGVILSSMILLINMLIAVNFILILAGFVLIEISSNVAVGAYQPLFVDLVEKNQRGSASGINGIFILIGSAMGYGITGLLISYRMYDYSIIIIVLVLIASGIITSITIKNDDVYVKTNFNIKSSIIDMFSLKNGLKEYKYLVAGTFFVLSGVSGLSFFELYFFKYALHAMNPSYYVSIAGIFVLIVSALASAILGYLSDKMNRIYILMVSSMLGSIAMFLIPEFQVFSFFLLFGSLIGASYGIFISVSKALASDMSPHDEGGKFMAYYNIATGGASSASPLIYGVILNYVSYSMFSYVFFAAGMMIFTGFIFIMMLKRKIINDKWN
ncbi:MFS transporter [Picrophilus oshimae]|uniref:Sugar transporter n=1 Tax=Picrophilus torridus (strain ATCC 700027 / DSM 9790 / JCM 10055 / NBRC 100828 / KAW 2/3) TaxID=1122961 RepID=Q6L301_PICTO|nr:MFS transporter [Picrophilus oshimae]AAT42650.1 sugar transporter [Picrophilus oshimae DSM 9789]